MATINEAGTYDVTVTSPEFGESNSGTPFLTCSFKTASGDTIQGWIYLSAKALPHAKKTLEDAFDFDGNFEKLIDQIDGKPCKIVVELEEYEGRERAKVKFINSVNGGYKAKPLANASSFLKNLTAQAKKLPANPKKNPF